MPQKHLTASITIHHWCLFHTPSFAKTGIWNDILAPGCHAGAVVSTVTLQHKGCEFNSQTFSCGYWISDCNTNPFSGDSELQSGQSLSPNGSLTFLQCNKYLFLKGTRMTYSKSTTRSAWDTLPEKWRDGWMDGWWGHKAATTNLMQNTSYSAAFVSGGKGPLQCRGPTAVTLSLPPLTR